MISIIDDDPSVLQATEGWVRSFGYHTATFGSVENFLRSSCLHETSCLITDVQMPGQSGVDLQDALITQGNRTPMIFVTAHPGEGIRHRVMAAGALGYLSKPFDGERLIEHIENALEAGDGAEDRQASRPKDAPT